MCSAHKVILSHRSPFFSLFLAGAVIPALTRQSKTTTRVSSTISSGLGWTSRCVAVVKRSSFIVFSKKLFSSVPGSSALLGHKTRRKLPEYDAQEEGMWRRRLTSSPLPHILGDEEADLHGCSGGGRARGRTSRSDSPGQN